MDQLARRDLGFERHGAIDDVAELGIDRLLLSDPADAIEPASRLVGLVATIAAVTLWRPAG